jgi:hypothetical protein
MNILGVNELLLELTPVTGLAASFGLVPTKSEFKKCDSLFFERSKGSGVPVTQPAGCGGKSLKLKGIRKSA